MESGWKCKKCGNQCGDVQNQGWNLGIAVEMKQESNGNGKIPKSGEK